MRAHTQKEPVTVFLADDDEEDWFLITRAFAQCCDWNVHPVGSGEELLDRLSMLDVRAASRPDDRFSSGKTPFRFLVMLDLHLSGESGLETLTRLKSSPAYRLIPVIIFSGSASPDDIARCYDLGANAFIEKPGNFAALARAVAVVYRFWSECVQVPYFDRARR
jgi:CheY-like chemotaxis protein